MLSASPLLFDDFSGSASPFSQGNTSTPASSISSMMGVVGGDAGWKLFNESSSLLEEGVVVFVTHQTALVVWKSDVCAGSMCLCAIIFHSALLRLLCYRYG